MPGAVSNSVVTTRPADVVGLMRKETATVTLRQYQRRLAQETLSFVCNNRKRTVQYQSSHCVPVSRSTAPMPATDPAPALPPATGASNGFVCDVTGCGRR